MNITISEKFLMVLFLGFFLLNVEKGYSQDCTIKFDYSVKKEGEVYSLSLTNELLAGSYELKLYDLNTGEVIEKKTLEFKSGDKKLVFSNITPSRYNVFVKENVCGTTRAIEGVLGINLASE